MGWQQQYTDKLVVDTVGVYPLGETTFVVPKDLSLYETVIIQGFANANAWLSVAWYDKNGNSLSEVLNYFPDPSGPIYAVIPVYGPQLRMWLNNDTDEDMYVYGVNRSLPPNLPRWGAEWSASFPAGTTAGALSLVNNTMPTQGLTNCYLSVYPLPSGLNRVQVQAQWPGIPAQGPNIILLDYTLPAAGTGIFYSFQTSFPPRGGYAPYVRLFTAPTATCGISLHCIQANPTY